MSMAKGTLSGSYSRSSHAFPLTNYYAPVSAKWREGRGQILMLGMKISLFTAGIGTKTEKPVADDVNYYNWLTTFFNNIATLLVFLKFADRKWPQYEQYLTIC